MGITNQEAQLMIEDCINRQEKLSEWELNFISSVQDKESFTNKQLDKLENIWDKITDGF